MSHPASIPPPAFSGRWITDTSDMAPFLTDWRRKWTGRALAVAQPDSTADVAAVIRWTISTFRIRSRSSSPEDAVAAAPA